MTSLRLDDAALSQIVRALREGSLTSRHLVEHAIVRHERASPTLDAYAHWAPETALSMAEAADAAFAAGQDRGALQGVPVSIKDLFGLAGMPIYAGSARALPAGFEADGPIVAGLRRQGVAFMGKTHTAEMAFGVCGHNVHWGTPRNPWDAAQVRPSGGSSSGAAISIAEGSALVALGSDSGGSVREPANMTGIVGLKVTHGRWSGEGLIPPGPHLHGPGLLTRTVADALTAFTAIDRAETPGAADEAPPVALADLRIGVLGNAFWADCAPGVAETVQAALDELARAGATLVAFDLPEVETLRQVSTEWDFGISAVELYQFLQSRLPDWWETLHPDAKRQVSRHAAMSAAEYLARCRQLSDLQQSAHERMQAVDVVAGPTSPLSPPLLDELSDAERYREINRLAARNTCVANLLDFCALTMPVGLDAAALPVGLQLMAANRRDARLLHAAAAVERALGTAHDRIGTAPLLRGLSDATP